MKFWIVKATGHNAPYEIGVNRTIKAIIRAETADKAAAMFDDPCDVEEVKIDGEAEIILEQYEDSSDI